MARSNRQSAKSAYRHGDLKNALVRAASARLQTTNIQDLSLRELAKHLGVSTAAPYSHFQNKEDLLNAVADQGFRLFFERLSESVPNAKRGRQQLVAFISDYLSWSEDEPGYYKVMFDSPYSRKHQDDEGTAFAYQVLEILLRLVREAAPRPLRKQAVRDRVILLCSVLHGLVTLNHAGPFTRLTGPKALQKLALHAGSRLLEC